jgi:hypothetical protein
MIKNLVYYCYFENSEINEFANYNINLLNRYLSTFNGQRIVKIAVDDLTKDVNHLINLFPNCDIEIVQNNKETRESEYFIQSLKEIKDTNSITFFAHNKGSKSGNPGNNVIKNWLLSMYFFNLEDSYLTKIENELNNEKTFSGIMRITTPCPPWVESDWHYSGTFFWFNTKKLFDISGWNDFKKGRFSVESYPGKMVNLEQSYFTLCSEGYNWNSYMPTIWNTYLTKEQLGEEQLNKYLELHKNIFQCIQL